VVFRSLSEVGSEVSFGSGMALNMAAHMNGSAAGYKMIEIKKVAGPVIPLAGPSGYETLSNSQTQTRIYQDMSGGGGSVTSSSVTTNTICSNAASQALYNTSHSLLHPSPGLQASSSGVGNGVSGPGANGMPGQALPPPPPTRQEQGQRSNGVEREKGTLARGTVASAAPGSDTPQPSSSMNGRPQEETNGVPTASPQELEFAAKLQEDEKWWWVCCLEFCFCLL